MHLPHEVPEGVAQLQLRGGVHHPELDKVASPEGIRGEREACNLWLSVALGFGRGRERRRRDKRLELYKAAGAIHGQTPTERVRKEREARNLLVPRCLWKAKLDPAFPAVLSTEGRVVGLCWEKLRPKGPKKKALGFGREREARERDKRLRALRAPCGHTLGYIGFSPPPGAAV